MEKLNRLNRIVSAWEADILGAKSLYGCKKLFSRSKMAVNKYCMENGVSDCFRMEAVKDLYSAYTSYCEKVSKRENNLIRLMIEMYNYHEDYKIFIEEMKKYGIVFVFNDSKYGVSTFVTTINGHMWYFEVSGSDRWRSPLLDEDGNVCE